VQQEQVQLRYYTVAAPTAGIIGDVPGAGRQPGHAADVADDDRSGTRRWRYVSVPVERARELKIGLPIRILSSDGQQRLASSTITFISPHVDDQTQSVLVKGTVRNGDGALRGSQFVRANIVWKTTEGLVIPVTAVLRLNGQFFAFVAEEAKDAPAGAGGPALVARQRAIKVGSIVGDNYAVLDGIKPNERVVVSGAQKLADGAPIMPQA
jgi:RND family efflux transporter MFP subunit